MPYLQCTVRPEWKDRLGVSMQQKDIVLKSSIAVIGTQYFLLGSKHLPGLGLGLQDLLQSEINLNCPNSTTASNMGGLFAKVMGGG